MSSIINHFQNLNISENLHKFLDNAVEYVKTPTTAKITSGMEILGFGAVLVGTLHAATGKKLRGAKEIVTGAAIAGGAAVVTALKQEYDQQNGFSLSDLFWTKAPIRKLADKIIDSPQTILETIKNKAAERAPDYLFGAGAATTLGGAIDYVRGNKKRGTAIALAGAAATAGSYFLKV